MSDETRKQGKNGAPEADGQAASEGAPVEAEEGKADPSAPAAELPPATPEERIAALEAERNDAKDRMLRIAAEFENWKSGRASRRPRPSPRRASAC